MGLEADPSFLLGYTMFCVMVKNHYGQMAYEKPIHFQDAITLAAFLKKSTTSEVWVEEIVKGEVVFATTVEGFSWTSTR